MGIARRIAELYQEKVNALLDRAEDPREMLDYSYAQQQEFLRRMRSAIADVAASRKHAEAQENELRRSADRLRAQAEQAVAAGKEELGRVALAHRAEMAAHADDLRAERAALRVEEDRLAEEAWRLENRFEVFRYRKEVLKAVYTAAQAVPAGTPVDSFANVADVAEAARRAEDQTAALQARAEALSAQIKAGGLWTLPPLNDYRIQEQLDALTRDAAVEEELAKIRAQMTPRTRKRPPGKSAGTVR
jgi:phage shock protein A